MRFLVFLLVAVELLQVAVIAALAVGYRNLDRRLSDVRRFEERPPRSITED
jgi:hypothetical protein